MASALLPRRIVISDSASYSVSFSPTAWSRVGTLRSEDFDVLRRAMNAVAGAIARLPWTSPAEFKRVSVKLEEGDVAARYYVDHLRRSVTVVDVEPQVESEHV